jgi:hypothetical protein
MTPLVLVPVSALLLTWRQILTAYIDVSMPFAQRQKDLLERYRFHCRCELCAQSLDQTTGYIDPRWAIKHAGCKGVKTGGIGLGPLPGMLLGAVSRETLRAYYGRGHLVDWAEHRLRDVWRTYQT